ncbi:MAG TPA: hypothetical protein VIE63_12220 [Ramlibacter sp.]|jgi:hypothetical protein
MFWIRSGLHSISISDWLTTGHAVLSDPSDVLEDARDAMLDVLGDDAQKKQSKLVLRIESAQDAQSLWALRPDLMNAASRLYGEAEARRRLARATVHFDTLLPTATGARRRKASGVGASR